MNKMFGKGKVLITYISVLAILAVSILSVFTSASFAVFADDAEGEEEVVITYPLNGKYDADYVEVTTQGIWYETVDKSKGIVDDFTGITEEDMKFCVNESTEGNGTANNPYIIKTAEQFAAVVTGNLKDEKGNWISTEGLSFKIADNIKAFNLNNTGSSVDFSSDKLTSEDVKKELQNATVIEGREWKFNTGGKNFMGRFDGNGACVYGLKAADTYTGIFPKIGGNITVKNLTVKNCYFEGNNAAVLFGSNSNPDSQLSINTKHFLYNCQVYSNYVVCTYRYNEAIQKAGILIGQTEGHYPAGGTWKNTESNLVVNDCLVYGNTAVHADNGKENERNITYGLVGNLHRDKSLIISNSIVLGSAPHALYYGSNAHLTSSYHDVYIDVIGYEWENFDISADTAKEGYSFANATTTRYVYDYSIDATGAPHVKFNHYDK